MNMLRISANTSGLHHGGTVDGRPGHSTNRRALGHDTDSSSVANVV